MYLDIHLDGRWRPCATLTPQEAAQPSRRGSVVLAYETDYALDCLGANDHRALTVRHPVDLGRHALPHWPSFLIDLLPQGAARKRLERLAENALSEWRLLEQGAANPVGNLRVRPTTEQPHRAHPGFALRDMTARRDAFIDYAHEVGATVAGATDTQGEAPKFWVVQDANGRWHPDDGNLAAVARRYALLKFPVPEAGARAEMILRNEAAYQRVAARLNIRVTQTLPEFIDGALLIPRFDRRNVDGKETRLGVESLYSVSGVLDSLERPLPHHEALLALHDCLTDFDGEIVEYMQRDLLNLALGNRDNHGRNTAVLKETDGAMQLAPVFDFGPSFLDARAIVRNMRWEGERGAGTDWNVVLENLLTRFEEADRPQAIRRPALAQCMRAFGTSLEQLPRLMSECGVAESIIEQRRTNIASLAGELVAVRT